MNRQIIEELQNIVGPEQVLTSPEDLICYSYDGTFTEHQPDVAVLPACTGEVSEVLKLAYREEIPVVPRGMGSGLAAGSIPFSGGIALSLTRMNRILEIDHANMMATAQAGVIAADLAAAVEAKGFFYPPDPASIKHSTIGGNVAANAGGPRCLKYGVTSDYVMALEVVLADGRILRTGGKAIKNVTGYNLVQLLVGSEGTLGVVTEVTVKLLAMPRARRTALVTFPRLTDASRAINAVLGTGILPATLELMDETAINCVEDYMRMGLPREAEAILVIETDGDEASARRDIEAIADICRQGGASEARVAATAVESDELWRARRSVSPSLGQKRPNKLGEDITVPRSAIPEMVARLKEISKRYSLPIVIFGHAGDGNLHPNILFDQRDPQEWERVEQAVGDIFTVAVELGGALTGEHGVGVLKRPYLEMNLGPIAIDAMRCVKKALDPKGILNPGKIFPD
jgi:glycolate oxidase